VAKVKDHSAGTSLGQNRVDLAIRQQDGKLLGEDVSMYIARPHLL